MPANNFIGQYRFPGSSVCTTNIGGTAESKDQSGSGFTFQDLVVVPSGGARLQPETDYYLKLRIPQDINYDLVFDIKLVKEQTSGSPDYQYLRRVSLMKGAVGNSKNVYNVVLYSPGMDSSGEEIVEVGIPVSLSVTGQPCEEGVLYETGDQEYGVGNASGGYDEIDKFNDLLVYASWRQDVNPDQFGEFEICFRPQQQFDYILFEMQRETIDFSIQTEDVIGRVVDPSLVNEQGIVLRRVNSLVDAMLDNNPTSYALDRIGVWGRSGLIIVINGEELRIGPSGFYELNEFEIETLGIVATDNVNDQFTIDYTYHEREEG